MTAPATPRPRSLAIIGGGIGGYTAAIRAARAGLQVTLVESGELGGTCLNRGCIPTKSLLHQAHEFRRLSHAARYGVDPALLKLDFAAVSQRQQDAVQQLVRGVQGLVRRNRIQLVTGTARFESPRRLRVHGSDAAIEADAVIIATGSEPVLPPIAGLDLPGVVTSDGALALDRVPRRLLVLGGGVIGVEFAQVFSDFGSEVTLIEQQERLLTEDDPEAVTVLQQRLQAGGVTTFTGTRLEAVTRIDQGLQARCHLPDGTVRDLVGDVLLVAVGRRPRVAGLNLEALGIEPVRGAIATDDQGQTRVPGVFAVGDVRGGPLLAHKAAAEAECVVATLLGQRASLSALVIPRAVYTAPELAAVGWTESQARDKLAGVKVGRFPFAASGKAIAQEDATGFVKVIADAATDQIVGITLVGPGVTQLLGEATLAVQMELTLSALMHTVHAHPTLSEALMEAAHDAFDGGAIHLPPRAPLPAASP